MPRIFFALALCLASAARAETVEILPQFNAYDTPRDMSGLAFQDAKGNWRHISDYRGKLVLLNLWATWCVPCLREMPALDDLQGVYKNTELIVLPVSLDRTSNADKIFDFYRHSYIKHLPVLNDPDMQLMRALHPDGLPTSYLITPDGRAVGKVEGFAPWDSPQAANLIESYLQKNKEK